ncbi:virion protein [Swinepox virus]|uniref:Virion protein n=1 Tax=Swinepox virus TaxID=10276 RepID=A0A881SY60_SWPV|nr:virion protein [Swinepox virus]
MNIDIKKLTNIIQNYNVVFPNELEKIYNEKCILLEKGFDGVVYRMHIYELIPRFDNKTILRIAKFLYRNNPSILDIIFINNIVYEEIEALIPSYTVTILNKQITTDDKIDTLTVLIHLFNSFRFGKNQDVPYYCLPLRKNIHDIIF